jgi:hypothetical protein
MSCTPSRTMLPIAVACVGDIPFAVQRPRARWSNHWQHLVACSWQRQHRTGPFLPVSLRWHETSALMHRGVRATLVREWRIASELTAGFPRQDQRWASSRVPSRLWRHSTQWRSTHRYCARARSAATPIENCRHQAAYLRDGGVPSGADVVPRSFRWARYQRA